MKEQRGGAIVLRSPDAEQISDIIQALEDSAVWCVVAQRRYTDDDGTEKREWIVRYGDYVTLPYVQTLIDWAIENDGPQYEDN